MNENFRYSPQAKLSFKNKIPNEAFNDEDSDGSDANLDRRGLASYEVSQRNFSEKQSLRLRTGRRSFSVQHSSMNRIVIPRRASINRPARRTSFAEEEPRPTRRMNVKVPRRLSDGQRSSGGSGRSNDSQNRSKNRSSSSAESIRSIGTTYSSGEKLNEGGISLLRRMLSRANPSSRYSDDGYGIGLMENHETLEFMAKRGEDEKGAMDTAAVQLVAAGMSGAKMQCRFGTNEHVLVSLEVMNQAALPEAISRDNKLRNALNGNEIADENLDSAILNKEIELEDKFTLEPVNRFGYPEGKGTKVEEQRGPYLYVLAQVKMVHFEEDARYYTVTRCDTGMDQRADSEWMVGESISPGKGLEAALLASKMNKKLKAEQTANRSKNMNAGSGKTQFETFIERYFTAPFLKVQTSAKHQMRLLLLGLPPYAFEIRFTGVHLLLLCSILFMFLDQIRLAFAPPSLDKPIIILNTIIWFILVFELIFEFLIRPKEYFAIIKSEKKYQPSTARFLNNFHLITESLALIFFIPEMQCLFISGDRCGEALPFTFLDASVRKTFGPERNHVALGAFIIGMLRLRIFGVVRHYKQKIFISNVIGDDVVTENIHKFNAPEEDIEVTDTLLHERERLIGTTARKKKKSENMSAIMSYDKERNQKEKLGPTAEEDRRLNDAANIGTALVVINSHRAMIILFITIGLFPFISLIKIKGGGNLSTFNLVSQLQSINEALPNNNTEDCKFLENSIENWVITLSQFDGHNSSIPILWARLLPVRCDFQVATNGMITSCGEENSDNRLWALLSPICESWSQHTVDTTKKGLSEFLNTREGSIHVTNVTNSFNEFSVIAYTDASEQVLLVNVSSMLLQCFASILMIFGLSLLRKDAGRLVLDPLRRMIKIVLHYAQNPLSPPPQWTSKQKSTKHENYDDEDNEVGNFETEQLITAVTKITDLLRKCWGVAGAGIISSNLARTHSGKTVVFNPLVPGKLVYALFGFCGIMDFAYLLHALDHAVIELINDVAKVVHDEVFRWGLGSRGQCNKNLGSSFLMVHRIGDFKEVHEKKNKATNVIFDQKQGLTKGSQKKRRNVSKSGKNHKLPFETVELASLPGISNFTDRAVIGMLKSFAGIHRDRSLLNWREDFRLGAGVGAFTVDMIFGMDAGWGVEGAVGSEHKIDATYLSPHVNMAARMMSATKQFGVHLLLSQAATELLSSEAKAKMRHLDTVTVKGSSVAQKIYTYDAKHIGVDFFLYSKTERLADLDSERFSPLTWKTDRDLVAMRQHVSEQFIHAFNYGRDCYLTGKWKVAITSLKRANNMMISTVLDEGCVEYEVEGLNEERLLDENDPDEEVIRLRKVLGDGPSMCLVAFMENRGGIAPSNWYGYRPLTSK